MRRTLYNFLPTFLSYLQYSCKVMAAGLLLLCCSTALRAQVTFDWVTTGTSVGGVYGYSVAMDAEGNSYMTGEFNDTVDFDPGPGVYQLTTFTTDIFVVKYNRQGELVWAISFGSLGSDAGTDLWVDASGNVYVTGVFVAEMDADPSPAIWNLFAVDNNDLFLSKFDSNGELQWAFNVGSPNFERGRALTGDPAGDVYVLAEIKGVCDFDPGPGVANVSNFGSGDAEMVIAKYNSAGEYQWASRMGGTGSDTGRDIEFAASGHVYVSGDFAGTADFDPSGATFNLVSSASLDGFVARYSASTGALSWAKKIGGTGSDAVYDVAVTDDGLVYIAGKFSGTCDMDPGVGVANQISAGNDDGFLAALDTTGTYAWSGRFGSSSVDRAQSLHADGQGHLLIAGRFRNTVDFDFGVGTQSVAAAGFDDAFLAAYTTTGSLIWAGQIGGLDSDDALSIANNGKGGLVMGGYFFDVTDFDPGPGVTAVNGGFSGAAWMTQLKLEFQDTAAPTVLCNSVTYHLDTTGAASVNLADVDLGSTDDTYLDSLWLSATNLDCANLGDQPLVLHARDFMGKEDSCTAVLTVLDTIAPEAHCQTLHRYLDSAGVMTLAAAELDSASLDNCTLDSLWTVPSVFTCLDTGWIVVKLFVKDASGNVDSCMSMILVSDTIGAGRVPVHLPDDYQFCSGSQVTLEAPPGYASYLWSSGETTSSLLVMGPGTYSVQVWNEFGCDGTDTIEVLGALRQDTLLPPTADHALCLNDTLQLAAAAGFSAYSWSDGTSGPILTTFTGGDYALTATDALGCSFFDSTHVDYYAVPLPAPIVVPGGVVGICDGTSITLDAGAGYATYEWDGGATTQTLDVSSGGLYTVQVTNGFGCIASSDPVLVVETTAPVISFSYAGAGDTLFASPTGAGYTYQWWVNGAYVPGGTNSWYRPTWTGIYKVEVTSPEGCSSTKDTLLTIIGVEDPLASQDMQLYPNPTKGEVQMSWTNAAREGDRVMVTDAMGRLVSNEALLSGATRHQVDLTHLSAGVYLISYTDGQFLRTWKALKVE
jgi:hypothetical protein